MKLSAPKIVLPIVLLIAILAAAAMPQVLGHRVAEALSSVQAADRNWLALAMLGFGAGFLACVCAWRTALAASGHSVSLGRGTACLGVGALVNTFTPAKIGDVVKIALFSRSIAGQDRMWTAGGVYAAVEASRCLSIAAFVVIASLTGALPLWPVFALCAGVAVLGAVAFASDHWKRYRRLAQVFAGFVALVRAPRFAAKVLGWSLATSLTRVLGVAALAAALGLPHPLLAALVICPALDLAGAIPLTPGNLGVASGAVAVALRSRGIGMTDALSVGIAIQALETLVSLVAGTAGALYFAQPTMVFGRWALRAAALGVPAGLAALMGALLLDVL
jgi:uncharacterized membrane protein YbhN (UPF0104 family)